MCYCRCDAADVMSLMTSPNGSQCNPTMKPPSSQFWHFEKEEKYYSSLLCFHFHRSVCTVMGSLVTNLTSFMIWLFSGESSSNHLVFPTFPNFADCNLLLVVLLMTMLKLFCYLHSDDHSNTFVVNIDEDEFIADLKGAIKEAET